MSADELTLILWVDGSEEAEKVVETRSAAVPRIGELVQLGPYGGPYEWRRVEDVTWRHNSPMRGGASVLVVLAAAVEARAERGRDAPKRAGSSEKPRRRDEARQPSLLDDPGRR